MLAGSRHPPAGFAKTLCSAVFVTGPDPTFANAAADPAPLALTRVEWAAFAIGGLSVVPLWSGLSRWLVAVDALVTSILFLVSTSVLFVWRCLVSAVLFVVRSRRHQAAP